jgi:molecular chaperone GrpE
MKSLRYIERKKNNLNNQQIELLNNKMNKLLNLFEDKLSFDSFKEQQIDKLHSELQEYKSNLLAKINRPLINGLICMYDDLDKTLNKIRNDDEFSQKSIKIIENIFEDIKILLEENSVISYYEINETFNPTKQQLAKKIMTKDIELVGKVAFSLRPGFELDNVIIRKEKVAVYVLEKK